MLVSKLRASPQVSWAGIRICSWPREICQNQSPLGPGHAAFPDQYVHLPNREIVILVSKVMTIFAPFHLFDAAAVSIPVCGAIPLCRLGCNGECKAASSSLLIC